MAFLLKRIPKRIFSLNDCKLCSTYSNIIEEVAVFSNGRQMNLKVPLQIASGSQGIAEVGIDGTVIFVSAVNKETTVLDGFLPLTVDYKEKFIPTGYLKSNRNENKNLMTRQVLIARSIDRSIRPLFTPGLKYEIQLSCKMRSSDGEYGPDVIGINAASACLAASSIPWHGPIAAVRVAHCNGKIITFPMRHELANSDLNLVVVVGKNKNIVMLEGSGNLVKKEVIKKAITTAIKECQPIISSINKLVKKIGISKQNDISVYNNLNEEIMEAARSLSEVRIRDVLTTYIYDKYKRDEKIQQIGKDVVENLCSHFKTTDSIKCKTYNDAFKRIINDVFRDLIFSEGLRIDGRNLEDLRSIHCDVNRYNAIHGSSRFERGQTIVECSVALESPNQSFDTDQLFDLKDNFNLDYEFPAFAVGEIRNSAKLSRREIGHGVLAKKALSPVIPDIPHSLSLSSEVFASNGSSSMATVCGGSMALMDAGINISCPVSGVAIGLVTKCNEHGEIEKHELLTDLLGFEDYHGDMDFKIASTQNGITALQADIKLMGIPPSIIFNAIDKAMVANKAILKIMKKTISKANANKTNLPVTKTMDITAGQKILLLGLGGRNLRSIQSTTGVGITFETDASVFIFAPTEEAMDKALQLIKVSIEKNVVEPLHGQVCNGVIREILDFGVMVELLPGMKPALLSNDHLHTKKVTHASELDLKVGDQLKVKYFGKDPVSGRLRLSRKTLFAESAKKSTEKSYSLI